MHLRRYHEYYTREYHPLWWFNVTSLTGRISVARLRLILRVHHFTPDPDAIFEDGLPRGAAFSEVARKRSATRALRRCRCRISWLCLYQVVLLTSFPWHFWHSHQKLGMGCGAEVRVLGLCGWMLCLPSFHLISHRPSNDTGSHSGINSRFNQRTCSPKYRTWNSRNSSQKCGLLACTLTGGVKRLCAKTRRVRISFLTFIAYTFALSIPR